jgi:hypothetical protein
MDELGFFPSDDRGGVFLAGRAVARALACVRSTDARSQKFSFSRLRGMLDRT